MDSMFSKSKEFYDLMSTFESTHKHLRLDREKRGDTPAGYWYQSGETNDIFKEYLNGYMAGRAVYVALADEAKADAALGRAVRKEMERLRNIRDDDNSLSGLSDTEDDFLGELESLNQAALAAAGLMEGEEK